MIRTNEDMLSSIEENQVRFLRLQFVDIQGMVKNVGIESLPGSLKEALDYLENDNIIRDALGEHVFADFMRLGRAEWDSYRIRVHQWELDRYLNIV